MIASLNGILANNRFLCRTNPTMAAAVADGGSVLDREYIQRCARQIVDMGHWDNLKFWGDSGLAEIDNRSSVDYVPKLYDISGEGNDGVQATDANQPVWGATGLTFDGSDDYIEATKIDVTSTITIMAWVKKNTKIIQAISQYYDHNANTRTFIFPYESNLGALASYIYNSAGTASNAFWSDYKDETLTDWHFVACTYDRNDADTIRNRIYFNGDYKAGNAGFDAEINVNANALLNISRWRSGVSTFIYTDASFNDIRIYNTALTATEIEDIYNLTSYKY